MANVPKSYYPLFTHSIGVWYNVAVQEERLKEVSRENGKTFAGTLAALNKKTVSGNLWVHKEQFFDKNLNSSIAILDDIEQNAENLSATTISELANTLQRKVGAMGDVCRNLIRLVESEEDRAATYEESRQAALPHELQ